MMLKFSDKTRELKKNREMGAEMCRDSVFNNTDVLSFQSTLAIQKRRKHIVRKNQNISGNNKKKKKALCSPCESCSFI